MANLQYGTRQAHPYADLWPLLPDTELRQLADDIRTHGLREPVWLHPDGRIVDGRNRWRACELAGVEPATRMYQGTEEELLSFLISLNMARRHMDESQRAMVAAKIANLGRGGDRRGEDFKASIDALVPQDKAAELMNVGRASVQRARKVAENAAPELVEAVESGRVSVSAAAGLVHAPAEEQRRVAEVSKTEDYRETQAAIQEARARIDVARVTDERDRTLWQSELPTRVAPPEGKFSCIVIDPPWPMQKIEREERPDQGVQLDYPVMSLEQIADETLVPVRTLAADNAHIYLWVTHKFLPAGMDLLDAWGFRYQCVMTWRKNVGITPFSWMYDTEHVLFGRKGSLDLQRLGLRLSFEAPVRGHSVKPDVFYERVVEATPGPRVEMFARRPREGFTVWGNEVTNVV